MKYTTRFGKILDISLDRYLTMSDDELSLLEEEQGTSLYPCDPLYISLTSINDIEILDIEEE